jgi:predicted RNase H-like nuclease (RuvC/YqgF family)
MELPKDLKDKVWNYCRLNDITDVNGFIIKTIKKGLDVEVYGFLGKTLNEGEKDLKTDNEGEKDLIDSRKTCGIEEKRAEIEVIREIRVEVPVEVIREVEKIVEIIKEIEVIKEVTVEVPVEKIVTKIEYISDKTSENELLLKIQQLEDNIFHLNDEIDTERQIFSTKTEQVENIFQNEMSKKDKELDELRRNLDIKKDDDQVKLLQETLQKLRKEISEKNKKIEELEKINKEPNNNAMNAFFMKGSNLKDIL